MKKGRQKTEAIDLVSQGSMETRMSRYIRRRSVAKFNAQLTAKSLYEFHIESNWLSSDLCKEYEPMIFRRRGIGCAIPVIRYIRCEQRIGQYTCDKCKDHEDCA